MKREKKNNLKYIGRLVSFKSHDGTVKKGVVVSISKNGLLEIKDFYGNKLINEV